jgi:hypothetical protein
MTPRLRWSLLPHAALDLVSDAQAAFKGVVGAVGAYLRTTGFRGSSGSWTLTNALGDAGVVNLQRSRWNTSDNVAFIVNLAIVPKPWFDWTRDAIIGRRPSAPKESDGLWWQRLQRAMTSSDSESERWWEVTDEASAERCRVDLERQLADYGVPRLRELLDREQLLREIREGTTKPRIDVDVAIAILLSDAGASSELDRAMAGARARLATWNKLPKLEEWVNGRATDPPSSASLR